jgi:hypothetical protein
MAAALQFLLFLAIAGVVVHLVHKQMKKDGDKFTDILDRD